jgi:GH24 family phage-related lysozyme (muramidase)
MAKYEDCRKTPYYCPAGVLTVGIGSTSKVENRQYAEGEIAERWVNDLDARRESALTASLTALLHRRKFSRA